MSVGIRVEGAANLRRTLRAAGEDLSDLKAAHAAASAIALAHAAALAPVRTGRLKASMRSSGTKTSGVLRTGGARVPYAGPIHWGWRRRHITPSLFLTRGAQQSEPIWVPVFERALDDAIERARGL